MQSILKLAALLFMALFVALAAIHGHQGHSSRMSRSWPEHVLARSPRPASLQDQQSMSLMSWLFDSQHSHFMAAEAPVSTCFNASALSPAEAAALQPSTCDVLALNAGPGNYNRVRFCTHFVHASCPHSRVIRCVPVLWSSFGCEVVCQKYLLSCAWKARMHVSKTESTCAPHGD